MHDPHTLAEKTRAYDIPGMCPLCQAEQIKQLRRNLHEECAASANTIRLLQEQIKIKDEAIRAAVQILEQVLKE